LTQFFAVVTSEPFSSFFLRQMAKHYVSTGMTVI